jgi:hypothetical protein
MALRNRIVEHVRVPARALVPHELNPRLHSDEQQQALRHLYERIGFARSLLAYRLPDGRLKLIDGHLRQSLTPDEEVEVEVLDVTDEEARTLLLSIDPLAQLADYDHQVIDKLRAITETDNDTLHNLWQSLGEAARQTEETIREASKRKHPRTPAPTFAILIECPDERSQVALLRSLRSQGHKCKALLS